MDDRMGSGFFPVRSWHGDVAGVLDEPLEQGAVRISGTVLDEGCAWFAVRDRLGWSTVALLDHAEGRTIPDLRPTLRAIASRVADPVETALAIRERVGIEAPYVGLALVRVAPSGGLIELINVSLPTVIVWDPSEGISPYEPRYDSLAELGSRASTEVVRLHAGAVVALTTRGVLPSHADWRELSGFVRAMGIDPMGGTVAEAAPREIARVLETSWEGQPGPRAVVMVGLPLAQVQVA